MFLPRKFLTALLATCLLIAQIQGGAHGIAHLKLDPSFKSSTAPHATLCADCASLAQATAVPIADGPYGPVVAPAFVPHSGAATWNAGGVASAYRSRGPPAASI